MMVTSRALTYLVRRRYVLSCTVQMSSIKSNSFYLPFHTSQLSYADHKSVIKSEHKESDNQVQVGFAEVVKENTKSAWYMSVIIAGVGVTSVIFYAIFRELFSGKSPNSVYTKALDRCLSNTKLVDALGEPIKAFGEETRRGRRGHVQHTLYKGEDGVDRMRMKFYIQGSRKRGTVHLEVIENSNGKWDYRYLFVQLQDLTRSVIVLEDNRNVEQIIYKTEDDEFMPSGLKA